jgi:5'-3' exonuclease
VPDPLLVVDAPSLLYRGYHALPDSIRGPAGPVNALLGATNMVLAVVLERRPRAVVLCSGPDAARYRTELYPPYHAHRPEVPDDLARQFAEAPEFFAGFGWAWTADDELEADDVLASYAQVERAAAGSALIMTGDRDLFQCAGDGVDILYVRTGTRGYEEVGAAEVRRRYGVPPELVPDFIALRGDPSDGLPGAKGIGEKTAAELLREHGSLEAALDAWTRVRPARVAGALRDQREELVMFKEIATLRPVPVALPADSPTDLLSGARAARSAGMERLASRLEGLRD